jgi:hypothetical protein
MVIDADEDELVECGWSARPDALRTAAWPLIEAVFAATAEGRQREQAIKEIIAAVERVRGILPTRRLN